MASARRIVLHVSTAVKQLRAISSARRRVDLSTGISEWSRRGMRIDAVKQGNNRNLSTNTATNDYDYFREIGYTDVVDLLSTPERDFLLRNNGQKVPVSSLKGKLVGLYLRERIPPPHCNRIQVLKKVYEEVKSRGFDFEMVQITFDFHPKQLGTNPIVEQFRNDILWLTLPSTNSGFRKIQRIFRCSNHKEDTYWGGDSLVLIHPPQAEAHDILFEFSGAEILQQWGVEGYPFTRPALYKVEYELQKREVTLQWFFPPGESLLMRPRPSGHGFDLVDAHSQLSGKRVLVLFASYSVGDYGVNFVSKLKSEYQAQVAGESQFEVVYVSTKSSGSSSFDEFTKDMPWLVQPFPSDAHCVRLCKAFKPRPRGAAAVAFNEQGEFIAKEDFLNVKKEADNLQFPFIDQDLETPIRAEVTKSVILLPDLCISAMLVIQHITGTGTDLLSLVLLSLCKFATLVLHVPYSSSSSTLGESECK